MLRRGVLPKEYTYYNLMYAYCEKGEFSKAFHMHEEMIHKGFLPDFFTRFSPSLVTCNALIHGLSFFGRAEEALEILRGMPEMGLFPDTVSYTAVVSGFCQIGELRKAYDLKMEMDEMLTSDTSDVRPLSGDVLRSLITEEGDLLDEVNYTSVINAYCADGEVVKAEKLLDELTHYDVRRCVIYDVFVNGLDKKARTKEAKEMLLGWVFYMWWSTWPTLTFDTLIENCSNNEFKSLVELVKGLRTRDLENAAASVMNTVFQWNYKPDGAVYNFLIVEHCRCKNVDKAYNMYTEMVHYGIAPHMFSVLALIHVLYCDDRYNEMSWVIQNTLRSSNLNDSELHKLLNEIGISKGKFKEDALFNVLAEIAMDGLLLNGGKCSYAPTRA
ncbi:pentatricopeptide repeat-containing protein At5g39710-like [Lotus japonicus]|uniref:pentatricopeptide repeat-containing protein At5g39710-like n=1 Tax=Lotus japonicus TaxID=34305 RepID=UPI002583874E|nr:pentatricopeptide repeat-containing protein At5g39710-like [Lotus japonicus]XP_057456290.1 pentatricopeptide repeat-containing protein At5g39710-like [Lotus japonicus]XP_057456291.1 pentatricopeptide repeat-containing protein At5g39710-like [Lotus japonicus]